MTAESQDGPPPPRRFPMKNGYLNQLYKKDSPDDKNTHTVLLDLTQRSDLPNGTIFEVSINPRNGNVDRIISRKE